MEAPAAQEQWLWQKERVLAWVRLGFSIAGILVIQLNPGRVAKFPVLSQIFLLSFFVYSGAVLYYTRRAGAAVRRLGLATTGFDVLLISGILAFTGGSNTPFFIYYLFPVIAASSRYGVRGSMSVAVIGVILYGFIRFDPFWRRPIAIDIYLIRSFYLLVVAYIFGFLSEFENKQNQRLVALSRTASEAAAEEERGRIASELHDNLLQLLASLIFRIEACREHLIGNRTEMIRELQLIEEGARASMDEIRRFLAGDMAYDLAAGTLLDKLTQELKFLRDGLGIRVTLESVPDQLKLPGPIEQQVYRVVKEGLTNVARHSQASELAISLQQGEKELNAVLKDNGIGFDYEAARRANPPGYGLRSMAQRIQKLRGRFSIKSAPGEGTELAFSIPLQDGVQRLDKRADFETPISDRPQS